MVFHETYKTLYHIAHGQSMEKAVHRMKESLSVISITKN